MAFRKIRFQSKRVHRQTRRKRVKSIFIGTSAARLQITFHRTSLSRIESIAGGFRRTAFSRTAFGSSTLTQTILTLDQLAQIARRGQLTWDLEIFPPPFFPLHRHLRWSRFDALVHFPQCAPANQRNPGNIIKNQPRPLFAEHLLLYIFALAFIR